MGMHHSFSGKSGYDVCWVPGGLEIQAQQLLAVLKEEDRLRKDQSWQQRFALFDTNDWRQQICDALQRTALDAANVAEADKDKGLVTLRNWRGMRSRSSDDPLTPCYVQFDRAIGHPKYRTPCPKDSATFAANVRLLKISGEETTLLKALSELVPCPETKPVVVLAGSIT